MRIVQTACTVLILVGCAARGPSDAEVRTTLDARLAEVTAQVGSGDVAGFLSHVADDATLVIRGIRMGSGDVLDTDVEGITQIRQFMEYAAAPPLFRMTPTGFTRSGRFATQTGTWSIGGQQTGTFEMEWRNDGGEWRVLLWRLEAD
jgi:hypothetical protein